MSFEIITLDEGDIIIFNSQLVHCGEEYDSDNLRVFVYCDINLNEVHNHSRVLCEDFGTAALRVHNTTNIISDINGKTWGAKPFFK